MEKEVSTLEQRTSRRRGKNVYRGAIRRSLTRSKFTSVCYTLADLLLLCLNLKMKRGLIFPSNFLKLKKLKNYLLNLNLILNIKLNLNHFVKLKKLKNYFFNLPF